MGLQTPIPCRNEHIQCGHRNTTFLKRLTRVWGLGGRADGKIVYTYDVYWNLSDTTWASRWDAYLRMPGGRVHWFSIMTSLMVLLIMSSMVAMILMRTVRRDLARYEGLLGEPGIGPPAGHSSLDL